MKFGKRVFLLVTLLDLFSSSLFSQVETAKPVTPNVSAEAKALLQFIYNLSGKYTLTGQHNFPAAKDRNSKFAATYIGKTPVIWSTDFGFAKAGDKDSYLLRANMVEEAKRQYEKGSIITLCWHAAPPTANEPVTFLPAPGSGSGLLTSVQGRLTDDQFKDILTSGTPLNKQWMAQVDTIAYYLKQLEKAHVPVLWRPYHEMNGSWFWWGGRIDEYPTRALYRQLFERLVNYHKLTNLIWVWSVDRPSKPGMEFANFYPGTKYLDVLALDVYGSDFKQEYYDQLIGLSKGKPITLAEVGNPPSPEILDKQPKWSYWVIWAGMTHGTSKSQFDAINSDPHVLGLYDQPYIDAINPFRSQLGLPLLSTNRPADFTGEWVLNQDKSKLDNFAVGNLPHKLKIDQDDNELVVQRSYIEEWRDDRVVEEKLDINGEESKSVYFGFPRITTARLLSNQDTLTIKSNMTMNRGGQTTQIITTEIWSLQKDGKTLSVMQSTVSPTGDRKITMVYDRL